MTFAINLSGFNAVLNLTDCTFAGGGASTRVTLNVGSTLKTLSRPATLSVTRTFFTEIQQGLTGYGDARVIVKGGGSHRCYRALNALIRGESGNVTVEDWSATGVTNSGGAIIQVFNTYTVAGKKIAAFWVSGVTLRNVTITDNDFDIGIDSFKTRNSLEIKNSYIIGNKFVRCLETTGDTTVSFRNVTISKNNTISISVPYFDFLGSSYVFRNTKLTGNRAPLGSLFSLRERSVLKLTRVEIDSNYALQSILLTDFGSFLDMNVSAVRRNIAAYRDLMILNYQGDNSISDVVFAGNISNLLSDIV
ncbi:hypothetical protein HDU86_008314 [Geranomyces michiganensis]|nr:hypothetical protein HDU86_008314 [Geranomyces michiganensis]